MSDSSSFYTLHNKSPSSKSILISFAIQCECAGLISQKFHISIAKPGLHTAHAQLNHIQYGKRTKQQMGGDPFIFGLEGDADNAVSAFLLHH